MVASVKHSAQIPGREQCSILVGYYYFIRETVTESQLPPPLDAAEKKTRAAQPAQVSRPGDA